MKKYLCILALATVPLVACTESVQTTSGQEYLSQYSGVPVAPPTILKTDKGEQEIKSIDQRIRDAAAVEPILKFPAKIGLARIDRGNLSYIPAEEGAAWAKAQAKLGREFGEFVPVNIMVTKMVAENDRAINYNASSLDIINTIRLGAARQHLDAILIYEVFSKQSSSDNILKMGNVSIIGGYILPSETQNVEGYANALLVDVMQGYPYGTFQASVEKDSRLSSSWGWGSNREEAEAFSEEIKSKAVGKLSDEAYNMFVRLRTELAAKQAKK